MFPPSVCAQEENKNKATPFGLKHLLVSLSFKVFFIALRFFFFTRLSHEFKTFWLNKKLLSIHAKINLLKINKIPQKGI